MKLYNTLTKKKEEFKPLKKGKAGMYVCGPTVYDLGHLGHGRSAVSFDIIRKYLIYLGYNLTFVTNYTDIDDHMITRADLLKITVPQLAEKIIPEYQRDYAALGVMNGDFQPLATQHVKEMIDIISGLEIKGYTYLLDDGVYFDVSKFKDYGKLSGQKLEDLKSGIRIAVKEGKHTAHDFVLWKFSKPGEPVWESPWGKGRPGWHIECSAMSSKYLGETFDIHGGGADLIFPHHECEKAQSEAYFEKPFARYWLYNGFVNVNNEKMSKSLGNFFTLRDIFKKFSPQAVRFLFLQTHYRAPIEFSDGILQQSANGLARVHDFIRRLRNYKSTNVDLVQPEVTEFLADSKGKFEEAMNDDFETPAALAVCFDLIKFVNKMMDGALLTSKSKDSIINFLNRIDSVLGIFNPSAVEEIDDTVLHLIKAREEARKSKNWAEADRIRNELLQKGIALEDSPDGTTWKKL